MGCNSSFGVYRLFLVDAHNVCHVLHPTAFQRVMDSSTACRCISRTVSNGKKEERHGEGRAGISQKEEPLICFKKGSTAGINSTFANLFAKHFYVSKAKILWYAFKIEHVTVLYRSLGYNAWPWRVAQSCELSPKDADSACCVIQGKATYAHKPRASNIRHIWIYLDTVKYFYI